MLNNGGLVVLVARISLRRTIEYKVGLMSFLPSKLQACAIVLAILALPSARIRRTLASNAITATTLAQTLGQLKQCKVP